MTDLLGDHSLLRRVQDMRQKALSLVAALDLDNEAKIACSLCRGLLDDLNGLAVADAAYQTAGLIERHLHQNFCRRYFRNS